MRSRAFVPSSSTVGMASLSSRSMRAGKARSLSGPRLMRRAWLGSWPAGCSMPNGSRLANTFRKKHDDDEGSVPPSAALES